MMRCLSLLASARHPQAAALAISQLAEARTFTEEISALRTLTKLGGRRVDFHLDAFRERHRSEPLVIDQWFALQGARPHPDGIAFLRELVGRPDYTRTNPNRVRATLGAFATANAGAFHAESGAGYRFLGEQVLDMETRNPQVAARLLGLFEFWPKVGPARQSRVREVLEGIRAEASSDNVGEIAGKLLG